MDFSSAIIFSVHSTPVWFPIFTYVNIGNQTGVEWTEKIIAELKSMPNVTVKNRSQVFGYYDHNMLVMSERISDHLPKTQKYLPKQRLWYIRANEAVSYTHLRAHET